MTVNHNRRRLPPPPARRSRGASSIAESWRVLPPSLAILRAFLGVTFLYAGAQKLLDPSFLRPGSADFIGTQLEQFSRGSPVAWLLLPLSHVALLTGLAVALTEIAIGLGTLVGVAPRLMAAGGFLVNLVLLLSATWHVHPYFLGSDSIYAVAWAAYLAGLVERSRRAGLGQPAPLASGRRHAPASSMDRRELLRGAALAGATLATAAAAKAVSGTPAAATLAAESTATGPPIAAHGKAEGSRGGGEAAPSAAVPPTHQAQGTPIAPLSKVPVGGAIGFRAPGGRPAALVRLGPDRVVAYSRVCTHAGCLVGYDPSRRILYCPCHGAEYDPARGAEVIAGPAPAPLPEIAVTIDRATGEIVIPE